MNTDSKKVRKAYANHQTWLETKGKAGKSIEGKRLSLFKSDFSNAVLSFVNFYGTDFSSANLKNADLSHCNLNDTNFSSANLENVDLSHSEVIDADFTGANLTGVNLEGVKISDSPTLKAAISKMGL